MSCHEIEMMLSAYIDGELRDNDTEFVRFHIDECNHCAVKTNELKKVSSIASCIPDVEPPAFLMDKILSKTVYRQSFTERLIATIRANRLSSFAGAASALVLIAVAMWIYNPSASNIQATATDVSPGITQSVVAASNTVNQPPANTASIINAPKNLHIGKYMQNIRENRVKHKQYTYYIRKTSIGNKNMIASFKSNKAGKKTDLKMASSFNDKKSVETASIHKLNTDDIVSDTPSVEKTDIKTEDTSKMDVAANDKPSEQGIRTAKILAAERDNRLIQEIDALKEMRDKLRSRNMNRKYSNYHVQDMDDRTISVHIASVRF